MAQEEGTLAGQATGRPKKEVGHDGPLILKDIGIEPGQSKRAQKLVDIPDRTLKTCRKIHRQILLHRELRFPAT
ncbi:MAG: hypothetical protein IIA67_04480 [Planctomycetes bacterium]|nr:hypothetical protein [Planctomycetota bacterium]